MPTPNEQPRAPIQRTVGGGGLGFNGELLEPFIERYLLGSGYRAYSLVLMCFNKPDDMSPFGRGGLNAYAYCLGDPVNAVDPTGHSSWFSWFLAGPHKGYGTSAWGVGYNRGLVLEHLPTKLAKINGSAFSADEISFLQKGALPHLRSSAWLKKLEPLQLADMRTLNKQMMESIDAFGVRNLKVASTYVTREWFPRSWDRAGDSEIAIKIAAGYVPGVPVSHASKMMSISQAKLRFSWESQEDWTTRVGIKERSETFYGLHANQQIRGD